MLPWNKQQFWFWLAAILIVGGASTLRDMRHENPSFHASSRSSSIKHVVRSREELPEPNKLEVASNVQELSTQPQADRPNQIVTEAIHPETQIVQISFEGEKPVERPVVWLVGSIEPAED